MTTLQDVWAMLQVVKDPQARAAIGLTFFAGLVPSEARGALWENFDGMSLKITQSVWRTHTGQTKTEAREAPVPVIAPLRAILTELRAVDGNPLTGLILRGKRGRPLNLDNLSQRVIKPALDAAGIAWHGFTRPHWRRTMDLRRRGCCVIQRWRRQTAITFRQSRLKRSLQ